MIRTFVRDLSVILATVSLAAVSACKSTSGSATTPTNVSAAPSRRALPFEVLHNGNNSGFTRESEFVIQDIDELTRRWRGVQQGAPEAALPTVDFEKYTVVFVAIGGRNTGGYSVHVDSVKKELVGATVHYSVTSPSARCMSMQMLTSPLEVIVIEKMTDLIKFKKRGISGGC